ncbi:sugar transferase [Bacteroides sp. 519]|uniref:sugar transferase n=1 Tax=Bacteroides sp. 519 TaxID=2302937 RepID=UPI0013D2060C|nr:sugar transferase [Bacteroides sp. 519]NDV58559.1 sugar transferase [Bacteroides sp. 519]
MQYIIYIGKNKKFIKDFSQLSRRNIFYSANDYHKAIPSINKIENEEDIIVFYEHEDKEKEISDIKEIRQKHPLVYIVLITELSLGKDAPLYLKAGINNTLSPNTTQAEVDEIFQFHDKRRKDHSQKKERSYQIKVFKLPLWKRVFDIVFSSLALIILSPILIITALAICFESKGPILHKTKRVGTNYLIIDFLRFRSMYTVANNSKQFDFDDLTEDDMENEVVLISDDYIVSEKDYIIQTSKDTENNINTTKVGRFIRKYCIDELPQLINILKGDMSVVGNRPLPLDEAEQLTSDDYIDRFMAPAGLTGLWQVEKKGDPKKISAEERRLLDVKYAKTFSFSLDIKIIFKTLTAIVQKEN